MAFFSNPFSMQPMLNQNLRRISFDLYDDTPLLQPQIGQFAGQPQTQPGIRPEGGVGIGVQVPNANYVQTTQQNPQAFAPFQESGGGWFNTNYNPTLQMFLGSLAQAFSPVGTWQNNLGAMTSQFARNNLFNQLLQGSLAGGPNPFVSSSQALGPLAVGGLTPEQQIGVLGAMEKQELLPYQKFIRAATGIRALTPSAPSTPSKKTEIVTLNLDENKKQTSPREKHRWLIDKETGEPIKHLGAVLEAPPTTGAEGPKPKRLSITDVNKFLTQEFFPAWWQKTIAETGLDKAVKILDSIKDPKTGEISAPRLLARLDPALRKQWQSALKEYSGLTHDEAFVKLSERLQQTPVLIEDPNHAKTIPDGVPYMIKTKEGKVLLVVNQGGKTLLWE